MIKVTNCCVIYPDNTSALESVSFSMSKGDSVALLGENGAGKSTLIMALSGFILPSRGNIEICGLKLDKKNAKEIRKKIGIVFQNSDDQLFMPTVYDDVAFGPATSGLKGDDLKNCVEDAMLLTGVAHLRDKEPDCLSGGEKRRAAIAGVIAMKPDILIMDEPTAGLDYKSKKQLIELLNNIKSTKMIATHDMSFAYSVCERAIVLFDGKVKADGAIGDIFKNAPLLEECNLEPLNGEYLK